MKKGTIYILVNKTVLHDFALGVLGWARSHENT